MILPPVDPLSCNKPRASAPVILGLHFIGCKAEEAEWTRPMVECWGHLLSELVDPVACVPCLGFQGPLPLTIKPPPDKGHHQLRQISCLASSHASSCHQGRGPTGTSLKGSMLVSTQRFHSGGSDLGWGCCPDVHAVTCSRQEGRGRRGLRKPLIFWGVSQDL